ncbi:MAG: hypothetical protein IJN37_02980 [Clostridia bacterium]|nr:hypothetical protein [Clostridia bacterium]
MLENLYPEPEYNGTKDGELSKDIHKLYYWNQKHEWWYYNLDMNQIKVGQ